MIAVVLASVVSQPFSRSMKQCTVSFVVKMSSTSDAEPATLEATIV